MQHWLHSLFHFKELEIRQVKQYLKDRGVPVQIIIRDHAIAKANYSIMFDFTEKEDRKNGSDQ